MYTVKEAAKQLDVSEHTLRFYAKEGLFPQLKRDKNNVRIFSEEDITRGRFVFCLKAVNMPLKLIKQFMVMCEKNGTAETCLELLQKQRMEAVRQIEDLQQKLQMLDEKIYFYEDVVKKGIDIHSC